MTQPDENYEPKENKPIKEKNETEAEKTKRMEVAQRRKQIEEQIKVDQGN